MSSPEAGKNPNKVRVKFGSGRTQKTLTISVPRVALRRSKNHLRYWLVNVEQYLDVIVECDGSSLRPRMVLKIFCQVPQRHRQDHLSRVAMSRIRQRKPVALPPN